MATAAPTAAEKWTVLIDCDDEDKTRNYRLPVDTAVGDVKVKWAEDVGASADSTVMVALDDTVAGDAQTLRDIGEAVPGKKIVNLIAQEAAPLLVEVYKGPGWPERVAARLTQRPEELHGAVRKTFRIDDERLFRLRTRQAPLKYNLSLGEQGVDANTLLFIDLAFQLQVREPWGNTVEQLLLYSSEDCDQLRSEDDSKPQRLMCGRRAVDTGSDVIDALMPLGALTRAVFTLQVQVVRDIVVLANRAFRDRWAWPTDPVSQLVPRWPAMRSPMLDGQLLPRSATLCEADVADHSLVHDGVSVRVRCSDGRHRVVRVPRLGTVADIEAEVRAKEGSEEFALRRGARIFDKDETIGQAGIGDGDAVEVQRRSVTLTVTLSDRCVRWKTEAESLTFTDVVNALAAKSGVELVRLREKAFQCEGCGRRIDRAEEAFQVIPAACCRVRSLTLKEPTPPSTSDAGTQTLCRSLQAKAAHSASARPETADARSQTRAVRHEAGTQAGGATQDAAAQASQGKSAFGQQQPPPPPPRRFVIVDGTGPGYRDVPCVLHLRDPATVGEVRAAVARRLGLEPRGVELVRYVGRPSAGGPEVAAVCCSDGGIPRYPRDWEYGDAAGALWPLADVRWQGPTLDDDAAAFLLTPTRANFVIAYRR